MKHKKLCHFSFSERKNEQGWAGTDHSQFLVFLPFYGLQMFLFPSSKDDLEIQETMSLLHFMKGKLDFYIYGYGERLDLKNNS